MKYKTICRGPGKINEIKSNQVKVGKQKRENIFPSAKQSWELDHQINTMGREVVFAEKSKRMRLVNPRVFDYFYSFFFF